MPKLKEVNPFGYELNLQNRNISLGERDYLIQRRDQLQDKINFGLIALNGASLVALLSLLAGKGEASKALGFSGFNALWSATGFTVGLLLAAYAIARSHSVSIDEASNANTRLIKLSALVAHYENETSTEVFERNEELFNNYVAVPLTGFTYSRRAILAQSFSAWAWFFGLVTPLATALAPQLQMLIASL